MEPASLLQKNKIRLFSGSEIIYETEFDINGGNFEEWKEVR